MSHKLLMVMLAGLAAGTVSSFAGGSCCGANKAKSEASNYSADAEKSQCADFFAELNLNDEQKAKIAEIKKACEAEGKTEESCKKYMGQIRDVLNDEQRAHFDALMEKAGGSAACHTKNES